MKFNFILFLLFLSPFFGKAQILDSLDIYDHKEFKNQTLKVFSDNGLIKLQVIRANVVKVNFYNKNAPVLEDEQIPEALVYVRVTQNLEDIFMQTDSLLIIINKLDFTIKFQTVKEQLYTINNSVFLSNSCNSFSLAISKNEDFFNHKNRKLKQKIYRIENLKAIYSSKKYALYFQKAQKGYLEVNNQNLKFNYGDHKPLGYYFLSGGKKEVENNAELLLKNYY